MLALALIVPLAGEAHRVMPLLAALDAHRSGEAPCPAEVILVDSASPDGSATSLAAACRAYPWAKALRLRENAGYGASVQAGFGLLSAGITHVAWCPADGRYSIAALHDVWSMARAQPEAVHKGWRMARLSADDALSRGARAATRAYDMLVRRVSGLPVRDVNGQPKIVPVSFVHSLQRISLGAGWLFDAQLLVAAQARGLPIVEHPVTFFPATTPPSRGPWRWRLRGYGAQLRFTARELGRFRRLSSSK